MVAVGVRKGGLRTTERCILYSVLTFLVSYQVWPLSISTFYTNKIVMN